MTRVFAPAFRCAAFLCVVVCAAVLAAGSAAAGEPVASPPWQIVLERSDLVISTRGRPGADLLEISAVGTIDASPGAVEAVVDDYGAYAEFMPFVSKAEIIRREGPRRLSHQVLSFPAVSARDYVVWIDDASRGTGVTRVYRTAWRTALDAGPVPAPDVVRMPFAEGFWQVQAHPDGRRTVATYACFTDPGGSLPAWIVNLANRAAIEQVFDAVAARARTRPRQGDRRP